VGVTALCGITEPTLYGIGMKYKTPLYCAMVGGACGGLYAGITQVKQWAYGTSTIFALPVYIGSDHSFVNICIAVAIAMAVAFVLSFLTFKDPVAAPAEANN
jgi:PTS system beta-glucosides-specific IIC component